MIIQPFSRKTASESLPLRTPGPEPQISSSQPEGNSATGKRRARRSITLHWAALFALKGSLRYSANFAAVLGKASHDRATLREAYSKATVPNNALHVCVAVRRHDVWFIVVVPGSHGRDVNETSRAATAMSPGVAMVHCRARFTCADGHGPRKCSKRKSANLVRTRSTNDIHTNETKKWPLQQKLALASPGMHEGEGNLPWGCSNTARSFLICGS